MRVAIAGAGKVGRSVARELVDYGHKILLIERERSNFEPQSVAGADWLNADACELDTLEEAGTETCDVVVAATGDDKANLVVGLLAKSEFGVPRVVARINVVELEAKPVLSEDDSDEKEEQQAGKSDACRDPGTHDAGEQYQPTDEQVQVQLVQAHFVPVGRL
ncbi:Putative potassium uptake protein [Mycobacteroides abscessus subsp. abscessus]|nr:Putative potassium uptake protein [Mycobacteroides abscessus subsp. abscessus]